MRMTLGLLVSMLALGLAGCDLDESKYNDLTFDNASRYTVEVIPLTSEWEGFFLAPDERKEFGDIDNPDFEWKPLDKVDKGVSSTTRKIIFVDRAAVLPPPQPPPVIIIVTNK